MSLSLLMEVHEEDQFQAQKRQGKKRREAAKQLGRLVDSSHPERHMTRLRTDLKKSLLRGGESR